MKILIAPSWYPPLGGRFFRQQAEQFHRMGHSVEVVALHWRSWRSFRRPPLPHPLGFPEHHHFLLRWPGIDVGNIRRWIRRYQELLGEAVERTRPDIIYVLSALPAGISAWAVASRYRIPYVVAEHRGIFLNPAEDVLIGVFHHPLQEVFRRAHRVIAVSSALARAIKGWAPLSSPPQVIPNMAKTHVFRPGPPPPPRPPFIFLTAGRFHPVKGMDLGLHAFSRLHRRYGDGVQWWVVGDGPEKRPFLRQMRRLGLSRSVKILPRASHAELAKLYHQVHALLLPSRQESFGMVAVEALLSGRPVVATRSGGPEDIIQPPRNGFLAPLTAEGLAEAMAECIRSYDTFDPTQLAAEAQQRYSPEVVGKALIETLRP